METYFTWVTIGILAFFLGMGLIIGLCRGLKRASLHIIFLLVCMALAFFITKPITNLVLGISISVNGTPTLLSEIILNFVQTKFDLSNFGTAKEFLQQIPMAVASPILFIVITLLTYMIVNIIYLIVARCVFGSKKKDFKENKPYRAYGAVVGLVEGFLFMFVLFAPLTSLTQTYSQIVEVETSQTSTQSTSSEKLKTVSENLSDIIPKSVTEGINNFNNSVLGKISGAGGLNHALFDYLSNFNLDGEKIEFRKEIVTAVEVYDEFTVVYNQYIDKQFENINLTEFKLHLETLLNNGLFKTVVSDTINQVVVNFDEFAGIQNNLPALAVDMINDIKVKFAQQDFNTYEYLKHDLLKVVDTAQKVLTSDLPNKIKNIASTSFMDILEFVDQNSTDIGNIAKEVLSLNIANDCFKTIVDFGSQKLESAIKNDASLEIALNNSIQNKNDMIDKLTGVVNDFVEVNQIIDIPNLINSEDKLKALINTTNLEDAFDKVGSTLDKIRNLELFVLPKTAERPEKVYVVDNILKTYNLSLLGDEVYFSENDNSKTKLENYSLFFEFLKTPINKAKEIGLLDFDAEADFNAILDKILTALKNDSQTLSKTLLPLYQLSAMNLNQVFDDVVNQLSNSLSMIDFAEISQENSYHTWKNQLNLVADTLIALDQGEVGVNKQTYLDYILSESPDLKTLITEMLNDNKLQEVFQPMFKSKALKNFTLQIFDTFDQSIKELTKVEPKTFENAQQLTIFENQETTIKTIECLEDLLNIIREKDVSTLELVEVGNILDILKINAYNEGNYNGVFNNVFANLIWYLTGDNLNAFDYGQNQTHANFDDIKTFIGVVENQEYYTINFTQMFEEFKDITSFADSLKSKIKEIQFTSEEDITTFVSSVKEATDNMSQVDEADKVKVIEKLTELVEKNNKPLLTAEQTQQYGELIFNKINTEFEQSTLLADKLAELFGVKPSAEIVK